MDGCTNSITAKNIGLHADLMPNVDTHLEKPVVRRRTGKPTDASASQRMKGTVKIGAGCKADLGLKIGEYRSAEAVVWSQEIDTVRRGSVQRKDARTNRKGFDNTHAAFSSRSKKTGSACMHAVPASLCPTTSTSTRRSDSTNSGGQKIIASNVLHQQRVFSAKHGIFIPNKQQYVSTCQETWGGNMIKSAAPRTKPMPRWCPTGPTHTQKRWVQRLRALEINEEMAAKKCDEWFNRNRPIMHMKRISGGGTSLHI
jgi:hypothetical protein